MTSAKDAISKFSEYIHHLAKTVADKLGYGYDAAEEEDYDDDHNVGQDEDDFDDYDETEIEG